MKHPYVASKQHITQGRRNSTGILKRPRLKTCVGLVGKCFLANKGRGLTALVLLD